MQNVEIRFRFFVFSSINGSTLHSIGFNLETNEMKIPTAPERLTVSYENLSHGFTQQSADYTKQYCALYKIRLNQMETILNNRIKSKWKDTYSIIKLYKLSENPRQKCIVIGTLFKDQKLKPSILKLLAEENHLVPQPIRTNFTDESDKLYIEDELQRYEVIGGPSTDTVVTGITCVFLGEDDGKGKFIVDDYIFAGFREQIPRPSLTTNAYIIFMSGLDLVNLSNCTTNLQMFIQWLSGLGDSSDDLDISQITRLIIAGNSVRNIKEPAKPSISMLSRIPEAQDTIEAVRELDNFLLQLCEIIEVDLMPGENDPSNHILPQCPMHYCMFPKASVYKSLNQVSNPYYCSVDGVRILGTSGQPIRDVLRFSEITEPLDALEDCLNWGHVAPTAPDTLGCFPFYDKDPFVLEDCPHVFFVGNQSTFSTRITTGNDGQSVRLICIPEFANNQQVCLLNLRTLECKRMCFYTN